MNDVFEPPVSTAWFQRQLNLIARDRNVVLRIAWAPALIVAKVVDSDGRRREYRKYPLLGVGRFEHYILGHSYERFIRGRYRVIAYQPQGALIPGNVLPTDIAIPHIEKLNHSIHIFVIEKQLPDEYARQLWAEKREMARARVGFDLFGAFPKEGVWDWWADVSEHRDGCCEMAAERRVHCRGLYREPSYWDLDRVAAELKARDERPNLEDPTPLIEQGARDIVEALEQQDYEETAEILAEAREHAPDLLKGESQVGFTGHLTQENNNVNAPDPGTSA